MPSVLETTAQDFSDQGRRTSFSNTAQTPQHCDLVTARHLLTLFGNSRALNVKRLELFLQEAKAFELSSQFTHEEGSQCATVASSDLIEPGLPFSAMEPPNIADPMQVQQSPDPIDMTRALFDQLRALAGEPLGVFLIRCGNPNRATDRLVPQKVSLQREDHRLDVDPVSLHPTASARYRKAARIQDGHVNSVIH